jgi:hypothetical protein
MLFSAAARAVFSASSRWSFFSSTSISVADRRRRLRVSQFRKAFLRTRLPDFV